MKRTLAPLIILVFELATASGQSLEIADLETRMVAKEGGRPWSGPPGERWFCAITAHVEPSGR